MKKLLILLFFLIGSTTLYSQTVIKLTKKHDLYFMTCKVNGLPLDFVYDTGASTVLISLAEAIFMFKNGLLTEKDIVGGTKFGTADGSIHEGTIVNLKRLQIGDLTLSNVQANVVHNMNAPLLLGQSALSRLGKIVFDYSNSTLTIMNNKNTVIADNRIAQFPNIKPLKTFSKIRDGVLLSTLFDSEIFIVRNSDKEKMVKWRPNYSESKQLERKAAISADGYCYSLIDTIMYFNGYGEEWAVVAIGTYGLDQNGRFNNSHVSAPTLSIALLKKNKTYSWDLICFNKIFKRLFGSYGKMGNLGIEKFGRDVYYLLLESGYCAQGDCQTDKEYYDLISPNLIFFDEAFLTPMFEVTTYTSSDRFNDMSETTIRKINLDNRDYIT